MFIYPTVKRVTSHFRTPSRPTHHGTDFAQSGYHEIVAVADGTVSRSYRSTSYGEVVFIVHNINGQTWESVYAHMRTGSRRVKQGDKVKQGQVIGVMGNTGHSTGQHLHFELHKGRWNMQKNNAVDPMKYLQDEPKSPQPTDSGRYRLKTGTFEDIEHVVNAREKLIDEYKWLVYYAADNTKFDPPMRLYTGTFVGKNVAEHHAEQIKKKFGWTVYVMKA
ncbi:M23 family metallopeptidase [Bacillaceae bacterium W0354]